MEFIPVCLAYLLNAASKIDARSSGGVFPVVDVMMIAERFHKGSGAKEKTLLGGRKGTLTPSLVRPTN